MNGTVHLLWFVPKDDEDEEQATLIGVYTSAAEANSAIQRLQGKPGFVDYPEGFRIYTRELNEDTWTSGFFRF
jgi:homoserine kinase type II